MPTAWPILEPRSGDLAAQGMVVSWTVSLLVCATAAYRLRATPLATVCLALTGLTLIATLLSIVFLLRKKSVPAGLTALSHVCGALGAFFVFVSFSLP